MKKLSPAQKRLWPFYVDFVTNGLNTTPSPSLEGFSSWFLRFGRPPRTLLDEKLGINLEDVELSDYASDLVHNIRDGLAVATRARVMAKSKEDEQLKKRQHVQEFQISDAVMVERSALPKGVSAKLAVGYDGPYAITELHGLNEVVVDEPAGPVTRHVSELKNFRGEVADLDPKLRLAKLSALKHDFDLWEECDETEKVDLTHDTIVGRRIRMHWPQYRGWYDGIVSRRLGEKRHEVFYFDDLQEFPEKLLGYAAGKGSKWILLKPRQSPLKRGGDEGEAKS